MNPVVPKQFVKIFHQDDYFTKPFLAYEKRVDDSYEDGSGIDWEKLYHLVQDELSRETPAANTLVIVEGHMIADTSIDRWNTILRHENRYNCQQHKKSSPMSCCFRLLLVELKSSQEVCKQRRLNRRHDRPIEEYQILDKYFDTYVWPSYLKYGLPTINKMIQEIRSYNNNTIDDEDEKDRFTAITCHEITNSNSGDVSTSSIEALVQEFIHDKLFFL